MKPVSLLVLKTGRPIEAVERARGSFARLFHGFLETGGIPVRIEELDATVLNEAAPLPPLSSFEGVVVTGSPAYVEDDEPWMRFCVRLLREVLEREVPLLGVCFGHQLIGRALGADVGENPRGREMGTIEIEVDAGADPLLSALPRRFSAQVTHRDVIRSLAPGLKVLGRAPHDPFHVVRAGRVAWGVQFHPEFDDDVRRAYLHARAAMMDEAHGPGTAAARLRGVRATPVAASLLPAFARLCAAEAGRAPTDGEVRRGA